MTKTPHKSFYFFLCYKTAGKIYSSLVNRGSYKTPNSSSRKQVSNMGPLLWDFLVNKSQAKLDKCILPWICRWIHPSDAINTVRGSQGWSGFKGLVLPALAAQQYWLLMGVLQKGAPREPWIRGYGFLVIFPWVLVLLSTFSTTSTWET